MKTKKGFTLIELTLAIAFISILLITIGVVTMDIISTYRKGIAMKSVNTTGLNLISDFSSAISEAPATTLSNLCEIYRDVDDDAFEACNLDNAQEFIYQEYTIDSLRIDGEVSDGTRPVAGAFCSGKYSYLWKTGYVLNEDLYTAAVDGENLPVATLTYHLAGAAESTTLNNFRLLKFKDPARSLCVNNTNLTENKYEYNNNDLSFDITTANGQLYDLTEEPVELLPASNEKSGLALYSFVIYPPTQDPTSKEFFYSSSMVLATIVGGVDIIKTGDYCAAPNEFFSDFNYCAINKFNFAMRATGE